MTAEEWGAVQKCEPAQTIDSVPNDATAWFATACNNPPTQTITIYKSGVGLTTSDYYIVVSDSKGSVIKEIDPINEDEIPEKDRPIYDSQEYIGDVVSRIKVFIDAYKSSDIDRIVPYARKKPIAEYI